MSLAASAVLRRRRPRASPASAGCIRRRLRRPQPPQRGAAHPDAGRLPLLGQDRGAPAHLVGRAHRRRAAGIPRHGWRALARLPHRLLSDPAADGTGELRLLAVPAGDCARRSTQLAFWGVVFLLSGIGIHRARRYRLSRTRWRGIRGGLSGRSRGLCLDLSVDDAAGAADARLDPAVARRAAAAGRSSTRRASATTGSPSPASPGRSTGASGWCGSAGLVLVIVASVAICRHHRFRACRRSGGNVPSHARSSAAARSRP